MIGRVKHLISDEKGEEGGETMNNSQDRKAVYPESQLALNRLLSITQYSLASYLLGSPPWTSRGAEPLVEAACRIAQDQQAQAMRVGRLLVRRHGYAESGQFPTQFTEYNDLALDYLALRLIEHERVLIDEVVRCGEQLAGDPEAKQLAEEVLAGERRHLSLLTRLVLPGSTPAQEPLRATP